MVITYIIIFLSILISNVSNINHTNEITLSWLALTDPRDVARVESRTFISTSKQIDTVPTPRHGIFL